MVKCYTRPQFYAMTEESVVKLKTLLQLQLSDIRLSINEQTRNRCLVFHQMVAGGIYS